MGGEQEEFSGKQKNGKLRVLEVHRGGFRKRNSAV